MNKNVLFHNPNCSKSRETLEILKQNGIDIAIVEYLSNPPSVEELEYICHKLQVHPTAIFRTKDKTFADLGLGPDDQRTDGDWFLILNKNPVLLERPILVYNGKVAIGRPPENILNII